MQEQTGLFQPNIVTKWFVIQRCYAINFPFFEMKPHYHTELELMYAVHGKCKIICWNKGREQEVYQLKEGEYIFLDSNVPHQLEVTKEQPCRILNLEIGIRAALQGFCLDKLYELSSSLKEMLNTPTHAYKCSDHGGSLYRIIFEMQKQHADRMDQLEQHLEVNLLLSPFFIELARQRFKRNNVSLGSMNVKRAINYIERHYEEDIKVEEIAEAIGVSISHLQRLFKLQTGLSMIDKINEFRINKAKLLLESSSLPVVDIAFMAGFHNRQHFTYTFTKLTGCSPALYKKQKGNQQLSMGFHQAFKL